MRGGKAVRTATPRSDRQARAYFDSAICFSVNT